VTPGEKESALYAPRFVFRRLGYALAIAGVAGVAYLLRGVLVPLFLAFVVAYALDPVVERGTRLGLRRSTSALLVMLGLVGCTMALLAVSLPYFFDEFSEAAAALPGQLQGFQERFEPWLWERFRVRLPQSWGDVTRDYGDEIRHNLPQFAERAMPALFGTFNLVVVLGGFLIVPVFSLYLLMDFNIIVRRAGVLVPRRYASEIHDIAREIHHTLGRYVRGQITACLVLAAIYTLGLKVLGLRLAIPIGVITGLLAFIPYIGFGGGLSLALGVALLDWRGPGFLVGVVAVMALGQLLDALLVTPRIVGGSVGLKPIEVLLTMMAAGTLFGFVGVLLAVPLGAVAKILVTRATEAYLRSLYYRQIPPTSTPTPLPGARFADENIPPTHRPEVPPKLAGEPLVGQKFPTPLSVRIEQGRG
jgi:predicted PurR-regulated permease PerM